MKLKKEYIILALIIIGLSVYLFVRKGDRTLYELPVLAEVSKNAFLHYAMFYFKYFIFLIF